MKDAILNDTARACRAIFCVLLAVHAFEAIVLRTDETVFGENFINKLFGILVLWLVLRALQWGWRDIGFSGKDLAKNLGRGFLLAAAVFAVAYAIEFFSLRSEGHAVRFDFFATGFSLTGAAEAHRGAGFILLCVFFNLVNVVMEEGTFRGLFYELLTLDRSLKASILTQALLFGIWHVVTPLHNLIDGDLNTSGFLALSAGYVILAGIMGVKWTLMYQMTGSLYAGMADHFFNNCIATNLLHLTTETGTDELMTVRVLIAQALSFVIVLMMWKSFSRKKKHPENI